MSSISATPTVDGLRERGAWSSALDKFAEWDPDWIERCARMTNNPGQPGVLPVRWIELICIALNAGATRDEILDTFKGVRVLGIHSVAVALPILINQATT